MSPWIIGVGGATTSGKTSLIRSLCEELHLDEDKHVVHTDRHFKGRGKPRNSFLNCADWEHPQSLNIPILLADIKAHSEQLNDKSLLFVEGFLVFAIPEVDDLFDLRIFLSIDKETCRQRRLASGKRGRQRTSMPAYFQHAIWPAYLKYNSAILNNCFHDEQICILDGNQDPRQILCDTINVLVERQFLP